MGERSEKEIEEGVRDREGRDEKQGEKEEEKDLREKGKI